MERYSGGAPSMSVGRPLTANLGLVESATTWDICNPPAWHVGINDTFSMQDIWDMFGPYIKLLQFGLFFHFSPVFFGFIINILFATGMAM
jgi:hypothetical protein